MPLSGAFAVHFNLRAQVGTLGPLARALERNGLKLASVARLKFAQRFPAKRTHTGVLRSNSGGTTQHNFIGVKKCFEFYSITFMSLSYSL